MLSMFMRVIVTKIDARSYVYKLKFIFEEKPLRGTDYRFIRAKLKNKYSKSAHSYWSLR
jgi:hypothetical protein